MAAAIIVVLCVVVPLFVWGLEGCREIIMRRRRSRRELEEEVEQLRSRGAWQERIIERVIAANDRFQRHAEKQRQEIAALQQQGCTRDG